MYANLIRRTIFLVASAMSIYHLVIPFIGAPEAMYFRGTHLLFSLTLVFLLYPYPALVRRAERPGALDLALIVASFVCIVYLWVNYDHLLDRIVYVDDLTTVQLVLGSIFVVIVLDATRRVIGWALPVTAIVFLAYAVVIAKSRPEQIIEMMYVTTEGIFGSTLGVSASYVILFVLFGTFMERTGVGQLFMDFALALTGRTAGGPGKVAVVSSSLFGTISGSAVANVLVDGPITIPLMKRSGFRPAFAAAVEAVASTGGQIMPPIMGAAAFVMAEFMAVSYFQVTLWALIPAVLYYVAVFFAVHFEAKRVGLLGLPAAEVPRLGTVMRERGHMFTPILVVLGGLTLGYSAPLCALAGTLSCVPVALLRKTTRKNVTWQGIVRALEDGAKHALPVALACASAGIVIGAIALTGVGIKFTSFVLTLTQESLVIALLLMMVAGIILGMGMPTTPAYIVMVALLVPAIHKLGVVLPAAHMFAFYFAILSAITPPVALAVYAAAGLAKADMWASGWAAMRAAAPAYIVPFMFVYEPALLMIGDWQTTVHAAATATAGTIILSAGLFGYLLRPCMMWERAVLVAAAFMLIKPGWITDAIGFGLLAVVFGVQWFARRRVVRSAA
ncbi:MAG: TRAP transporter permease [Bacteroidota bacterium]